MTEEQFWRCTPRKLLALFDVYVEANSTDEELAKRGRGKRRNKESNKEAINSIASW
jgi:hypothetical protein